ncbi:TIGR02680 family protein [Patulibacter sp. NPDC049589]|uniref:TIGR02680 family protein n=1 Tax=Patulibacter sp. NPDC049589 TaxID=3154731 RepID=UPI00343962FF
MTDRFRPHRYGVVGLYEYADQEFGAHDGRLALRGRNTSGKSKALELLMPFVLDGDVTPRKLDPFASAAKTMRWNLIECTDAYPDRRANKRVGYVWAEFRRPDGDGERFLTCGIGLEATRSTDGVKRWYFVTEQRVGADLHLTRAAVGQDPQPVVRAELAEQLTAGGGALFDAPTAYKEALREHLLPFSTPALYEQTLEVIRQLRKPKLSESLNVTRLSQMLSSALPAVDGDLVRKLGDALEQLHELQRQYDELAGARRLVASIVEQQYRAYARGVVRTRADALKSTNTRWDAARAEQRRTAAAHETAVVEREDAETALAHATGAWQRTSEEYETLIGSSAYEVIGLLEERRRARDEARSRADRARDRVRAAHEVAVRAEGRRDEELAAAQRAAEDLTEATEILTDRLSTAGLDPVPPERPALAALPARVALRRQDVERAEALVAALARAEALLEALAEDLAVAATGRDAAAEQVTAADGRLERVTEELLEGLRSWRASLTEIVLADEALDALADGIVAGGDPQVGLRPWFESRSEALAAERVATAHGIETLATEHADAAEELRELEATRDPEPPVRSPRRADRRGRVGAPLWAVCDFRPHVPAEDRGAVEAALEEAGVLDAWIDPDGAIHDADLTLVGGGAASPAGDATATGTLADLLVPDPGDRGIPSETVAGVLRSLPLSGPLSVAPGTFRFGPLHGRATKPGAEFIGAAARAARRERLLAAARDRLAELDRRLAVLRAQAEQQAAAQQRLHDERVALPGAGALRDAEREARRAADRLQDAERALAQKIAERDRREQVRAGARVAVDEHARAHGLPTAPAALRDAATALERVELAVDETVRAIDRRDATEARVAAVAEDHRAAVDATTAADQDSRDADGQLDAAEGRLAATESAHGSTASELQARAGQLRVDRAARQAARDRAERRRADLIGALKDAERAAEDAAGAVQTAEAERVAALDAVRVLGTHDLLTAAFGPEGAPDDERASATWPLTTALERVRALPEHATDAGADLERRARRVSEAVSALQKTLTAFDMDAATIPVDGITLVEVQRDGRRTTPTAMLTELDGDVAHREQVLSAKRREVLGHALLGEIAEHLRGRITGVRASLRSRNQTLRRCPTGAGRTVSLRWDPDEDAGAPAAVLDLLGDRAAEHLSEDEQGALFGFLEQRIADARAGLEDGDGEQGLVDHLSVALDYRRWWRFSLHLHEPDGTTKRLTARTQGLGSGGEQSVLMHLPLFATAAALYDLAPGAPRIIALDEAMDGIDPTTREQVFALLVELDLDWVMTSFELNPCVATVPGAGLYELHRENAEWGVWAQHFVWDGRDMTEVVDG